MAKKKYLQPRQVLSRAEYEEYLRAKKTISRMNYQERMKEMGRSRMNLETGKYQKPSGEIGWRESQKRYAESRTGKVGSFLGKVFGAVGSRRGVSRALYSATGQLPPESMTRRMGKQSVQGWKSGKMGRPKGTYDLRYAQYGGVYGYRKFQAAQLRMAKLEAERRATLTPQEASTINRIRYMQSRPNPETQAIPDTHGTTPMKSYMDEIDAAANLVD